MPTATVTVRELKNKDTGIDLTVPTFKETRGLLGSTVEYHVVVVSSLPFFKSPKHKESDRVQFMISKKFTDFEDLHDNLNEKFSGTVFPPLPKKVLRVNEAIARERRSSLDHFLKLIAAIPKIGSSTLMLEFLGVNSITAGKYRRDGSTTENVKEDKEDKEDNDDEDKTVKQTSPDKDLFDDEDEEDDNSTGLFLEGGDNPTSDLFLEDTDSSKHSAEAAMFEEQDYGGGITEEDEKNLFLPDSIITKKVTVAADEIEETLDLFEIDDNLDDLMNIDISKSKKPITEENLSTNEHSSSTNLPANEETSSINLPASQNLASTNLSANEDAASRPSKPKLPQKPKPAPRSKPLGGSATPARENPKPAIRQKPPVAKKPESVEKVEDKESSSVDNLNTDDILKYIESNAESKDSDLDLFS